MNIFLLVFPWAAIGVALAVVAAGAVTGKNVFKKQGVAWVLTIVMVCVSIGIGYARGPINDPKPEPGLIQGPGAMPSYVRDDANVLGNEAIRELDQRNQRLWERHQVSIGVITCNYNRDDLYQYAAKQFEKMGLGGDDMLVVLDIKGDSYWLYTGDDVAWQFSDEDCSDYAYEYMEYEFAHGFYGDAALELTKALELWYGNYYG